MRLGIQSNNALTRLKNINYKKIIFFFIIATIFTDNLSDAKVKTRSRVALSQGRAQKTAAELAKLIQLVSGGYTESAYGEHDKLTEKDEKADIIPDLRGEKSFVTYFERKQNLGN